MVTAKYKIKLSYTTGDSCDTRDTSDYLELTWKNIDVAKENLQRIKEHYLMHKAIKKYNAKPTDKILKENKNQRWFVYVPKLFCISNDSAINEKDKKKVGEGNWEYRADHYFGEKCLNIISDNGDNMQLHAFWCGHFETLHSAEIECENSDMKIEF